jgi:hypothetical protein
MAGEQHGHGMLRVNRPLDFHSFVLKLPEYGAAVPKRVAV